MNKRVILWAAIAIALLAVGILFARFFIGGSEDDWIKDSKGVYVKHGNPAETPGYVTEQQDAIECASRLYKNVSAEGDLISQCLGSCGNYAVDIVHAPRTSDDNLIENQCADYLNGKTRYFIEIDTNGSIVRVA